MLTQFSNGPFRNVLDLIESTESAESISREKFTENVNVGCWVVTEAVEATMLDCPRQFEAAGEAVDRRLLGSRC